MEKIESFKVNHELLKKESMYLERIMIIIQTI